MEPSEQAKILNKTFWSTSVINIISVMFVINNLATEMIWSGTFLSVPVIDHLSVCYVKNGSHNVVIYSTITDTN